MTDEMSKIMERRAAELFGSQVKERGTFESVLNLEKILEAKRTLDRHDRLYVIASESIPDDALGVLIVRPETLRDYKRRETAGEGGE